MHSMNLKNQILTYNKYTVLTISWAVLSVLSLFSALRASVWSRNKGGGGGVGQAHRAPPLDPPLIVMLENVLLL